VDGKSVAGMVGMAWLVNLQIPDRRGAEIPATGPLYDNAVFRPQLRNPRGNAAWN
jgi:hypothetical protein